MLNNKHFLYGNNKYSFIVLENLYYLYITYFVKIVISYDMFCVFFIDL